MTAQGFMTWMGTAVMALALTLTGCSDDQDVGDQAEEAGEAVEETMEKAGDQAGDAVEETGEAVQEGANTAMDKAEDAAEQMEKGADRVQEKMDDPNDTQDQE